MKLIALLLLGLLSIASVSGECSCEEGKYWDDATKTCLDPPTLVDNCRLYYKESSSVVCSLCNLNYQKTASNTCVETDLQNCEEVETDDKTKCKDCESGYYQDASQHCVANPDTVPHCTRYYFEGTLSCTRCDEGYSEIDGACVQHTIDNCSDFRDESGQKVCQHCKEGYYRATDKLSCIMNPGSGDTGYVEGCNSYSMTGSDLTCESCDAVSGYAFESNGCVSVGANKVEMCAYYQQDGGAWKCSSCKGNHYKTLETGSDFNISSCTECPYTPPSEEDPNSSKASVLVSVGLVVIALLF